MCRLTVLSHKRGEKGSFLPRTTLEGTLPILILEGINSYGFFSQRRCSTYYKMDNRSKYRPPERRYMRTYTVKNHPNRDLGIRVGLEFTSRFRIFTGLHHGSGPYRDDLC